MLFAGSACRVQAAQVHVSLSQIWVALEGLLEFGDGFSDKALVSVGQSQIVVQDCRVGFEGKPFLQKLDIEVEFGV